MTHKVLITGAGGFLGRAIAKQCLARNYEVFGVARSAYPDLEQPLSHALAAAPMFQQI